jgi:tetratricopeptide (TPR) repeat protein/tRNA A-37 threonylcarbamoyl transferase component Bud32
VAELKDRLQAALGAGYRVERELGGGGMSRVFLAEEVRLGRRVVVKVLPPEMAAGVSVDRFEREIQLAAKLQHPHIVPLLTADASDDLLYYIMPYIEGESLRAKLAREGELPVPEALRILRDVLDALAYAHRQHVVHRDIKPDNVMLSQGHALVTDFGVAKAVAESTGKNTITSMGVALGTPLYMAPEQAAANPNIDHRADLYAVGVLTYEMLCGRTPFTGPNPQAVLSAHVTQAPEPCTQHRPAVPPALNELVMRCLEKHPADRWQRAEELQPLLEAILTPTGGTTPTGTQPVISTGTQAAIDRAHPVRVGVLFGLASVGVLAIVYPLVQVIGLPDWVFYGAIALLAIGLPIMLVTGHHERQRALARSSGRVTVTPPGGVPRWFTWRKALLGGGLAFAGLGVVATGYMAMRALGIGPVGSLLASGKLGAEERIIVADFANATPDTALGQTVTDLLRIALGQSPVVTVMEPVQVSDALERMRRARNTSLAPELAAEVAAREGLKAYVAGELRPVGGEYVISARLVAAATGDALVAVSEQASGAGGLIKAVGHISAKLRERIGESLRTVRADPPLERLTTTSLEALRVYGQATRLADQGDFDRAIALLQEAVKQDSMFAMAYRRLGAYMTNPGQVEFLGTQGRAALARAYALRDRLSDRERYHVEALYAVRVDSDNERAVTAYLALLEKYPKDPTALNNIAVSYWGLGRFTERDAAYRRAIAAGGAPGFAYTSLLLALERQGNFAGADSILRLFGARFPTSPQVIQWSSNLAATRRDFDRAREAAKRLLAEQPGMKVWALQRLAAIAQVRGRLEEAGSRSDEAAGLEAQRRGLPPEERDVLMALGRMELAAWSEPDAPRLAGQVESLWGRNQRVTAGRNAAARRYDRFITLLAHVGRAPVARRLFEEFRSGLPAVDRGSVFWKYRLRELEGEVRVAERRPLEAVAMYQAMRQELQGECAVCYVQQLGYAYDRAEKVDSAIAYYGRYADAFGLASPGGSLDDQFWLAPVYRRLGELYQQRGEHEKALDYYGRFADLWKDADANLQPVVREVRQRMARLVGEKR